MNRFALIASLFFACSPVKGTPLIDADIISIDSLAITPGTVSSKYGFGMPTQLTVKAMLSDGESRDVSVYAKWTSSDDSVATVPAGLVTPQHAGTATITATVD